jgi:hypothetical protein
LGASITSSSIGSWDAVDLLDDDLGLADRELEALAAHGLDEDAQ